MDTPLLRKYNKVIQQFESLDHMTQIEHKLANNDVYKEYKKNKDLYDFVKKYDNPDHPIRENANGEPSLLDLLKRKPNTFENLPDTFE